MRAFALVAPSALLLVLGGCVMGPDFARPPAPPFSMGQTFARAESPPASSVRLGPWWRGLDDPLLDQLIEQALADNPTLDMAQARVRQARTQVRGAQAATAPVIGARAAAGEVRAPGILTAGEAQSSSVFVTGFDALWEIDVFGGRRREMEVSQAGHEVAVAMADDARLGLTAETARTYLTYRMVQHQLGLARETVAVQERALELTRQLEGAGRISRAERETVDRELESRRATVNTLEAALIDSRDVLAVLTGAAPGALDGLLAAGHPLPLPPAEVAINDPAAVLARRPDIRAAEQRLRAANARIGVAEAARMPRIGVAGIIGLGGVTNGDLVSSDNLFSLAAPSLQWNIADFGRGRAGVDQAAAGRDEADAAYRAAVLAALQDAESALNRYGEARRALAMRARSAESARSSAELANQLHRAGRSSSLEVLAAESLHLAAETQLIQARAELTIRYVALQKAMAIGYTTVETAR